MQKKNHHSMLK